MKKPNEFQLLFWHRRPGMRTVGDLLAQRVAISSLIFAFVGLGFYATAVRAQTATEPNELIADFQSQWDEGKWLQPNRMVPGGYMRDLNDRGFAVRMKVMQGLVAIGPEAISPLIEALRSDDDSVRILAAQVLGYLGTNVPTQPLLDAATSDPNASVRLYAVDSLGQIGAAPETFQGLLDQEKNRDVKMHLRYAVERNSTPMEQGVAQSLIDWDIDLIDTASVGKLAPDFELHSVTGQRFRLSEFRGKSSVVLVFIYGDT